VSEKRVDRKNRWRSKTVAFRMSTEEAAQLDRLAALSGMSKQDYLIHRVLMKDIAVQANPRIHKALRSQIEAIVSELERIEKATAEDDELLEYLAHLAGILAQIKGTEAS